MIKILNKLEFVTPPQFISIIFQIWNLDIPVVLMSTSVNYKLCSMKWTGRRKVRGDGREKGGKERQT